MEILPFQAGAKLICALLSLPTPPDFTSPGAEGVSDRMASSFEQKTLHKLLLVGSEKSGTCTIFKQVRIQWSEITYLMLVLLVINDKSSSVGSQ